MFNVETTAALRNWFRKNPNHNYLNILMQNNSNKQREGPIVIPIAPLIQWRMLIYTLSNDEPGQDKTSIILIT